MSGESAVAAKSGSAAAAKQTASPRWWQRKGLIACLTLLITVGGGYYWRFVWPDITEQVEDAGGRYFSYRDGSGWQSLLRSLTGGGSGIVHEIRFAEGRVTDAWLQRNQFRLEAMPNLHLQLSNPRVTDDGIAVLKSVPGLSMLDLSHSGVTDAGIAHLTGLTQLTALWLKGTAVTDAAVDNLNTMPLVLLNIADTNLTADGICRLKIATLTSIGIDAAQLTETSLESSFLKRQWLGFELTNADDDTVRQLNRLVLSSYVTIQGENVTDASVKELAGVIERGSLFSLKLLDTQISDEAVRRLRQVNPACSVHLMSTFDLNRIHLSSVRR